MEPKPERQPVSEEVSKREYTSVIQPRDTILR